MSKPIEIFISYAHKDESYRRDLESYLRLLKRQKLIQTWSDADITAGTEWKEAIKTHLDTAQVFLLLISSDFLASDHCYDTEMDQAVKRHKQGEARVIPIILSTVPEHAWKTAPFSEFQALPKDTKHEVKPIKSWHDKAEAYARVVDGIHKAIMELTPSAEPLEVAHPPKEVDLASPQPMSPILPIISPPVPEAPSSVASQPEEISNPLVGPTPSNEKVALTPLSPVPELGRISSVSKGDSSSVSPVLPKKLPFLPTLPPLWRRLMLVILVLLVVSGGLITVIAYHPFGQKPPATATHTPKKPLDVFVDELKAPFNLDTNTSPDELHGWYTRAQGMLSVTYPPHQSWGTISITVRNPVPLSERQASPNHVLNLSAYRSLVFDMRLVTGEPYVRVGIKDWKQCDDGSESTFRQLLTPQWTTVALPLNTFAGVDLTHVYVVFEINFQGSSSITVDVRNIRYSPVQAAPPRLSPILPPFNVYTDWGDSGNHYVPSGWMGTAIDARTDNNSSNCHLAPTSDSDISLTENWTANPHNGRTCIRVVFHAATLPDQNWAGVYWQDPVNNWGKTPGSTGYDLSHMSKLSFWVRGAVGGEQIKFLVGGITQDRDGNPLPNPDSATEETEYITLTTSWQQETISLKGDSLSHIIGGFAWVTDNSHNPNGATFYLNDIIFM